MSFRRYAAAEPGLVRALCRKFGLLISVLVMVLLVGLPIKHVAAAGVDIDRAISNLSGSSDFRVRAQAALALGASKSTRAVEPLCKALNDPVESVRAASVAGLGRLKLGGKGCLEQRLAVENSNSVATSIRKTIEIVGADREPEPSFAGDSKYYIAIGKITDKTGRTGTTIERLVRDTLRVKVAQIKGFVVAPSAETPEGAKKRLAGRSAIKPIYLMPRVAPPDYNAVGLSIRLEIAMFTYPDRSLIGNFSVKLTEPGVKDPNPRSEDDLIRAAAERAAEKLEKAASQIH